MPLMKDMLYAKVRQVEEVKEDLLKTGQKAIVEAVPGDFFWSAGISKEAAENTHPDFYPGQNILGRLWMEIREELQKEVKDKEEKDKKDKKRKLSQNAQDKNVKPRPNGTTPDKSKGAAGGKTGKKK